MPKNRFGPSTSRLARLDVDAVQGGVLCALILAVPTVFLRGAIKTFDAPQAALFAVLALTVLALRIFRAASTGLVERGPRPLSATSSALVVALVLTWVTSGQPWVSLTGATVRYAGALSYGLCLVLLHAVFRSARRGSVEPLLATFVVAHGVVVGYALLQAYGLDPFTWGEGDLYVGEVFSTLGNPNFSSAFIGLTLALLVRYQVDSRLPLIVRSIFGAAVGASSVALSYLGSFQGQVVSLTALGVMAVWASQQRGRYRLEALAAAAPVGVVVVAVPVLTNGPDLPTALTLMIALGTWTALMGVRQRRWSLQVGLDSPGLSQRRVGRGLTRGLAIGGVVIGVAGLGAAWPLISDDLAGGLGRRVEFWKISLSIFREHPLVGGGLETYPAYFTRLRSVDQAIEFEAVLSDSPHSVPLGLLSGGGLLLILAYLSIVILVGAYGIRAFRRTRGGEQLLVTAVLAAWIAYQVQSLVSIDVPGLIYTQWVFGGILLAKGVDGGVREVRIPGLRARGSSPLASGESVLGPVQRFLLAGSIGLVFLAVAIWVSAPLRADLHAGSAQKAFVQNDFQKAGDELQRAIELQPNNGFLADAMARVYRLSGLDELALEEFERSARLQPGYPGAARIAAGTALELGQYGLASEWYERLVLDDPNGAESLAEAAKFYVSIGRLDRSEVLLDRFYALDSTAPGGWLAAADTHEQLGQYSAAERIRLCLSENGQQSIGVGCVNRP